MLIGYLPSVAPLRLGEQFLEEHVLQLRIKHLHRHLQGKNEKEPDCEQPQDHVAEIKKAKKRTIRDMLIRAEQWRSLQASNPKLSLQ